MDSELTVAALRFEVYARDVLAPAIYPRAEPLRAEAFQCAEPVAYAEAVSADYRPAELGWRWGPVWSTAWFRVTGRVPNTIRTGSVMAPHQDEV